MYRLSISFSLLFAFGFIQGVYEDENSVIAAFEEKQKAFIQKTMNDLEPCLAEFRKRSEEFRQQERKLRSDMCAFEVQMRFLDPLEWELIIKSHLSHIFKSEIEDLKTALEECKKMDDCCENHHLQTSYNTLLDKVKKWSR